VQHLEGLRRPLAFAARDGFAHLEKVRDLGPTLRAAADRVLQAVGREPQAALLEWRRALDRFDAAPRGDRELIVARGLRLCAELLVGRVLPASPRTRSVAAAKRSGPAGRKPPTAVQKAVPSPATPTGAPGRKPRAAGQLSDSVTVLSGCGPRIGAALAARGVTTIGDLLALLPRRYQDRRDVRGVTATAALPEGREVVVRGRVERARAVPRRFVELVLGDVEGGSARLFARWFHLHGGFANRFQPGTTVLLAGVLRRYQGQPQLAHPDVLADGAQGITPIYPEIEGVPPRLLARLARDAVLRYGDAIEELLPESMRTRLGLPDRATSLRTLHAPPDHLASAEVQALDAAVTPAHRRLAFEEFFLLQIGIGRRRGAARREPGLACGVDAASELVRLRSIAPFALTSAQERAMAQIGADLAVPVPMQRLLQGDVGAGKTVVAFYAAQLAIASGYQAALMAPTEILAEQHLRTLEPWARALGHRVALLTASTPRGARESLLALLAAGQIQLLLGTHALLAERVDFDRLGLVVIDEQHRFGVAQRARLRDKGTGGVGAAAPHLLVMTATPIPRTLALTAYGDLDVTVLDELPPGRRPPRTRVFVGARARAQAYRQVAQRLQAGQQGYVVCPLVEESEKVDLADAVSTAQELARLLPSARVGLLHGRLGAAEKDDVMRRFRARELDLLCATTVIEVGVDVPDAHTMVVEHAERFGLAQLHQLRGRVGRAAGADAHCFLLTPRAGSPAAAERLRVMATTGDGFRIAEADLALRGFGELYGTRQAGMPRLRFGDLRRDLELMTEARAAAFALLEGDPTLEAPGHARLRAALDRLAQARLYGEEAG
jgi:ATP-dependent DNA helicase RecG